MPETPIDREAKAVDKTKIEPVSDAYAEAMRNRQAGFSITENGETTFAIPKSEFRKMTDDEKKDALKEQPKKEEVVDNKAAASSEPEVEEVDEDEFLKSQGVYNQYTKSLKDVDRQIEGLRKQVENNDEYLGNEDLFMEAEDPEGKIAQLRQLRKVYGDIVNRKKFGNRQSENSEPEKHQAQPKKDRVYDRLSDDDKAKLSDPTGEHVAEILDKMMEMRLNDQDEKINRRLDEREYKQFLKENPDFRQEEISRILRDKPYLKNALTNLSLEEKLDLLQTYRKSSQSKAEADEAEKRGRSEARREELRRKGAIRLRPSAATREVQSNEEKIEAELLFKIQEARKARKQGGNVRVANIVAEAYAPNSRRPSRTKGFDGL